jgi:hypothetical protein
MNFSTAVTTLFASFSNKDDSESGKLNAAAAHSVFSRYNLIRDRKSLRSV